MDDYIESLKYDKEDTKIYENFTIEKKYQHMI